MREVQSSDATAHFPQLLDEVERGETIIITRHGRPIARIVPEADSRTAETRKDMDRITINVLSFFYQVRKPIYE